MVYVANFGSESVSVISAATNKVVDTISGVGLEPNAVAVNYGDINDRPTDTVYVSTYWSSTVDVINGSTNSIEYDVPIPGANIHDVAVDPISGGVWASAYNLNEVYSIVGGSAVPAISTCAPDGISIDPGSGLLWVANNATCGTTPFGVNSYQAEGDWAGPNDSQINFAGTPSAPAFVDVNGGLDIFASLPSSNSVERIAQYPWNSTSAVLQTIPVGPDPAMLAIDSVNFNVVVANHGSHTVTLIHYTPTT